MLNDKINTIHLPYYTRAVIVGSTDWSTCTDWCPLTNNNTPCNSTTPCRFKP